MSAVPRYDKGNQDAQTIYPWQESPWSTKPTDYSIIRPPNRQTHYRAYRVARDGNPNSVRKTRRPKISDLTVMLLLASLAITLSIILLLIS